MLNLNKAISTPLAIGVILVLSILLGGFTLWQVSETKNEDFGGGEINVPEDKMVIPETTKEKKDLKIEFFLINCLWNAGRHKIGDIGLTELFKLNIDP